ncbi:phage head spike fiber domain-containing protein [Rhodovulum sulfidophilum]|uniref:Uncharacterized protein n=1 Tax=Rhodovulum sulfidophilum TaxID=35806 RepID=A0ABS1RQN4_RHOSU|nr:hypothetical protein [Rhodovulum sulfidophilum]MBL3608202.1 hypothetical protein [Rhodovulum sulfidophilum]MCE8456978.1 hypothetical protein [Rhodovulum sulfidophilum]
MAVTYTLGHAAASPYPMTHARILWDRLTGTVSATSEVEGFEAELANTVETNSWWKSASINSSWRLDFGGPALVDAIGVAAHNLGSTENAYRVERLTEDQQENILPYSESFGLWTYKARVAVSMGFPAPDRTNSATRLIEDLNTGGHYVQQDFDTVEGRTYTFSVYYKPIPGRGLRLALVNAGYPALALVNFDDSGAILSLNDKVSNATSVDVGEGWFRVSISAPAQVTGVAAARVLILNGNYGSAYTGDGSSFVNIFGAQLQWKDGPPSSYLRTTSAPVTSFWEAMSDAWTWPEDDGAILELFEPGEETGIGISVSKECRIGVVYTGKALEMPRMGYTNLGPTDLGRTAVLTSYISEGGQLMGRFIQRAGLSGAFEWQNLPEDWYRQTFDPFARAARTEPFFIAARPEGYPTDCAYAWVDDPIVPARQGMRNFVSVGFTATGHADAAA